MSLTVGTSVPILDGVEIVGIKADLLQLLIDEMRVQGAVEDRDLVLIS